ncbi:MAG: DsbA family protein [Pseudomonadota bacterium]
MFKNSLSLSGLVVGMAAAAMLLVSPVKAQNVDPVADKAAIEAIVRDYLLTNPEIMIEVQQALEAKQQAEAKERAAQALVQYNDVIFSSANQGVIGNPKGDVTVVEFFDYNCGFCQRAMEDMNTLISADPNINFVMKELPILSPGSVEASRISTAVYRLYPEQYARFHNTLLGLDGPKDGNRALETAGLMGLDLDEINAEAQKDDIVDAFQEVNQLATALGINGTPSYVIGDEVIFGALGADVLRQKIGNVRKCGKATC